VFGHSLTAVDTSFTGASRKITLCSEGKTEHPPLKKIQKEFKNKLVVIETITADFLLWFCEEIALENSGKCFQNEVEYVIECSELPSSTVLYDRSKS
jgi:hypothetical protein